MNTRVIFSILLLQLTLCACMGMVETRVKITNSSGNPVTVTSGHTGQSFEIKTDSSAVIPHTAGSIDIRLPNGKSWHYKEVSVLEHKDTASRSGIIVTKLTVTFLLTKDGTLVLVPAKKSALSAPVTIKPESTK